MSGCRRELCFAFEHSGCKGSAECENRIRLVGWILFFVATKKTWVQG
jgi:hypothetical protein